MKITKSKLDFHSLARLVCIKPSIVLLLNLCFAVFEWIYCDFCLSIFIHFFDKFPFSSLSVEMEACLNSKAIYNQGYCNAHYKVKKKCCLVPFVGAAFICQGVICRGRLKKAIEAFSFRSRSIASKNDLSVA